MKFAVLTAMPRFAVTIMREAGRHILRHPVAGIAACATTDDGRWVLIRRADTGTWALPGGTLEWGETLVAAIKRELLEEAGVRMQGAPTLVGVFSRPDRDPRFHAVTTVVRCHVAAPHQKPVNPLEIREVGLFREHELPAELAMGMGPMLAAARAGGSPIIE